jgi:hypothetical protein
MLQSLWECNRRDERAEVLFPIFLWGEATENGKSKFEIEKQGKLRASY